MAKENGIKGGLAADFTPSTATASRGGMGAANPPRRDPPMRVDALVDQHLKAVYAYALRLTGQSCDAEDLVQQTFLMAQQRIDQLRDASAARSWLLAIARNTFLKGLRRRGLFDNSSRPLDIYRVAAPPPVSKVVDENDLQAALQILSEEHRLILTMYYFEQLSYREIAKALNLKIGTVMSRLARGKEKLRKQLSERVATGVP